MVDIGKTVATLLAQRLQSSAGINTLLAGLRRTDSSAPKDIRLFMLRNVSAELLEQSNQGLYPAVLVYCEKLSNTLTEKFRTLSGTAKFAIELRNSEDRLEHLDSTLVYTGIIRNVLDNNRGEWVPGVFYDGEYEIVYSPVRAGGKHFLQSAKISLEINVSE